MKKRMYINIFSIALILGLCLLLSSKVFASQSSAYGYDYFQKIKSAPASYDRKKVLIHKDLFFDNESEKITDLLIDNDLNKKIISTEYLAKGTIYIYDSKFQLLSKNKTYTDSEGQVVEFNKITSISIYKNNLYVADVSFSKSFILKFEIIGNNLKYIKKINIANVEEIPIIKKAGFTPTKVFVSKTGAIYCLSQGITDGIIEMDENSNFKRFVGSNKINISKAEQIWQSFLPEGTVGKKSLKPAEFSSIAVDKRGFIFTTTSSAGNKPVQKLNFKGENVLIENGNTKVVGDIYSDEKEKSYFKDISVNDDGIYMVLDNSQDDAGGTQMYGKSRIFAYSATGDLLYIIGNKGDNSYDLLESPSCIRWDGRDIAVVDLGNSKSRVLIYEETEYGKEINEAVSHYIKGEFEQALPHWKKSIELNSNNELAYIGIGQVMLRQKRYNAALDNFKKGNNRYYYSKAYKYVRNERLKKAFVPIVVSIILFSITIKGVLVWIEKRA